MQKKNYSMYYRILKIEIEKLQRIFTARFNNYWVIILRIGVISELRVNNIVIIKFSTIK